MPRRRVRRIRLGRNVFLFIGGWVLLIHEVLGPGRDAFVAAAIALILAAPVSQVGSSARDREDGPRDDVDSGHR